MKFLIVLCAFLEATCGGLIDPGYGVPLGAPLQTITLPNGPGILTAPSHLRVVAGHQAPFAGRFVASPVAAPLAVAAPVAAAPVAVAAPVIASPTSVQHHSQDEFGAFNYGYQDINSAKEEVHTPDGVTRGSYSYVDANGLIQRVDYIADPINGFRVAGTNIPVAPAAPVVVDTPEVAAAKAEFEKAFAAAAVAADE